MNEIQKGFKKTEVGIVPNDWKTERLQYLTKDMLQGVNTAIDIPEYVDDGIPMLKANNIIDKTVIFDGADHVSLKTYKGYSERYKLKINDFLFSNIGARLGTGSLLRKNTECTFAWNVMRIIPDTTKINPEFLHQSMNSNILLQQVKMNEIGSGMGFVPKSIVKNIWLPLPPTKSEQTAIATVLNDTDSLITALEKLIAKKKAIKQGAMQELLKPKEGWVVKTIGDVADVVGGGTPSTFNSNYWNGEINWYTPTEIGRTKYSYQSIRKITKEGLKNSSAKLLPVGTVLLSSRASIGDASILMAEACTNQGFQSLISKEQNDNEFLYYLILTLKSILLQNASGSTFLEISPGKLKSIEVSIPDPKEQIRIARILSDMDTEIDAMEKKLEKYKMIKQGMMQVLLTGKVRLV